VIRAITGSILSVPGSAEGDEGRTMTKYDFMDALLIGKMIGGCNLIPYIDYSLCEGCGACAEIYPMFFMMKNDLPWLINHEKFVYEEHKAIPNCCPFRAIKIE